MVGTRDIRTIGIDGGKKNAYWSAWEGTTLRYTGHLENPSTLNGYWEQGFQNAVKHMLNKAGIEHGDDVVIERYQYRPGFGANSIEYINLANSVIGTQAYIRGANVYTIQASVHKSAFNKHHTSKFPSSLIKKISEKTGTWRPRLERWDPNPHVQDSMTLACWRILKRRGMI